MQSCGCNGTFPRRRRARIRRSDRLRRCSGAVVRIEGQLATSFLRQLPGQDRIEEVAHFAKELANQFGEFSRLGGRKCVDKRALREVNVCTQDRAFNPEGSRSEKTGWAKVYSAIDVNRTLLGPGLSVAQEKEDVRAETDVGVGTSAVEVEQGGALFRGQVEAAFDGCAEG